MSTIMVTPPSKVLVTGANGYIAVWVVDTLLKAGYTVRGTVRGWNKTKDLKDKFADFVKSGKLEFVIVEDITVEGSFDDAVKDVDGIIHMASPVIIDAKEADPQELIAPAVAGSLSILKSALKFGNALNRIVFTSSAAAIFNPATQPTILNETDWNDLSVEESEKLGKAAHPQDKYRASKVLAEKAFWEFFETHKKDVKWDICALNPPYVFGPALNSFQSPSQQNASTKMWWDNVIAIPPTSQSVSVFMNWVDVRDIALAHVLALQKPDAGGERLIISAGPFVWQDWHDIASTHRSPLKAHELSHHKEFGGYLPRGYPDIPRNRFLVYDNTKASRILGPEFKYRTMEQCTKDTLDDYAARGW